MTKKSERIKTSPLIFLDALERLVLALRLRLLLLARPRHLGQLGVDLGLVGLGGRLLQEESYERPAPKRMKPLKSRSKIFSDLDNAGGQADPKS